MTPWLLLALACTPPDEPAPVDTDPDPVGCAPTTWQPPPACGTGPVARGALFPGPADEGFDAELNAAATRTERQFHGVVASMMGVNTEITIPEGAPGDALLTFLDGGGWDATDAADAVTLWSKAAGAYAGLGIAADAYRYGTLRDEGAPCDEVDRAREHLLRGLDGLHRAVAITGTPGVIARGYARRDPRSYGSLVTTVPLFDDGGTALPTEKDNGTWREDVSGAQGDYVWEDSCSRDMLIGWAFAYGAVAEVVARDPSVPEAAKSTLRADALAIARSLLVLRDSGYDLEIMDADGRRTFHGILHEESVDRFYVAGFDNGQNAVMAMGILSALALAAEDADLHADVLARTVTDHDLVGVARRGLTLIDAGVAQNFSNVHMVMQGVLLSQRYTCDDDAREQLREITETSVYNVPGWERQPIEQQQALYDLTASLARAGLSAFQSTADPIDAPTRDAALVGLRAYPAAPYRDHAVENCDAGEIEAGSCVGIDGTPLTPLGDAGRNDTSIAVEPVPMRIRPPSNYHWRSNPYQVNGGGDGSNVMPGVDFRIAYWLGRWATPAARDR